MYFTRSADAHIFKSVTLSEDLLFANLIMIFQN